MPGWRVLSSHSRPQFSSTFSKSESAGLDMELQRLSSLRECTAQALCNEMGMLVLYEDDGTWCQRQKICDVLWAHVTRLDTQHGRVVADVVHAGFGLATVLQMWGMHEDASALMTRLSGHIRAVQEAAERDRQLCAVSIDCDVESEHSGLRFNAPPDHSLLLQACTNFISSLALESASE